MRYIVIHDGVSMGEVELQEMGVGTGRMVGHLEPTPDYGAIQPLCRRAVELVAASSDLAAGESDQTDAPSPAMLAAFQDALRAVGALGLELHDESERPVATAGPVILQDYSRAAHGGTIVVATTFAVADGQHSSSDT